jgi:hypothetical protein
MSKSKLLTNPRGCHGCYLHLSVQSAPITIRFVSLIQKLGNVNLIQPYVVIFELLAAGQWFLSITPDSSINKTNTQEINCHFMESGIVFVCLMVFNVTFNNISAISWQTVLLLEETEGPRENHDLSQVTDKLFHIILYTLPWSRFELTTSVAIGTDCIGSCKSNYHPIMATAAPRKVALSWVTKI